MTIIYIALGGAIGAIARHFMSGFIIHHIGDKLPLGTIFVNITGCFLIGFLGALAGRYNMSAEARSFVFVGFISAFTTFSTYSLETYNLFRSGQMGYAAVNFALSNVAGVAAVFLGVLISRCV
ncbi:MAG: fluoride efflux transporter CrcB [Candidatus Omnitrophica bacterium]|nr:fluoride efflux transporter CrcB [Candidatus Omnitrophota bacterium]MDD5487802.1 fluoride efflux transporter CrcB [Candidatus Omnitrophota bacterium]